MPSIPAAIALRYGAQNAPTPTLSNPVIDQMLAHRSVRSFRPDPLPDGTLETIIAAAQSAATSSNLQVWSVVVVSDPSVKEQCAALAGGQKHIEQCPVFLLFLADLARLDRVAGQVNIPRAGNDTFEMFLCAAIDASLAAQNATLAAESLGLSTVYIGGMRNNPEEVAQLVGLPPNCAVVFGLCLGYASQGHEGAVKPRLPQEAVLHHKRYDLARQDEAVQRYNTAMAGYYVREKMNVNAPWTVHSAKRIAGPESLSGRHLLMQAFRRLGFFKAE